MSCGKWFEVMQSARRAGCETLQFIGGEATLSPHLEQLIQEAASLSFKTIEVFSNLTVMSQSLWNTIKRTGTQIACSFYSLDPLVHDKIVGRQGAQEKTLRNIRMAISKGIVVRVGCVEMNENLGHVEELDLFFRSLGVSRISKDRVRSVGRGEFRVGNEVGKDLGCSELCGHCWDGKICVGSDGETFLCPIARNYPVGNVLSEGLSVIFDSTRLANVKNSLRTRFQLSGFRARACGIGSEGQGCTPTGQDDGSESGDSKGEDC